MASTVLVGLGVLVVLALALNAWQWVAARVWRTRVMHQPPGPWPGVSVLKPLHGADQHTERCLASWVQQEYAGPMEILFGAASEVDEGMGAARRALATRGEDVGRLVVCPEECGSNAKVSTLLQLLRRAKHDVVVVSDADVLAIPQVLRDLVVGLHQPGVGLVTCLYRLANPGNRAEQCEAIAVNADFWSQVLQSRTLWSMDFALGAVMALRREWLANAGGFEGLAEQLADDFQLGNRVHGAGGRVELGDVVVECWEDRRGWGEVWRRQLRWARTIRASRPMPFFFSLLNNVTLWALGLGGVGVAAAWLGWVPWGMGSAGFAGLAGLAVGLRIGIALDLQARWVPERSWRAPWWMVPVRDLVGAGTWLGAFASDTVEWKGRRFRVSWGGKLRRAEPGD